MKLFAKTLSISAIISIFVAVLAIFLPAIYQSFISFICIVIIFFGLLCTLIYLTHVKRIKKLASDLTQINAANFDDDHLTVSGKDELSTIASEINHLLDTNKQTIKDLQKQVDIHTDALTKSDAKLKTIINQNLAMQELSNQVDSIDKEHSTPNHYLDKLTNLPNRAFFTDTLNKSISHAKRHKKNLAVLIVNIDAFKDIGKTLGKNFADHVLQKVAHRLEQTLRTEDVVTRLEGDEFAILLNDIGKPKFASIVAEKILQACAKPLQDFLLTVSVGISIYPDDGESLENLLESANKALYMAKHAGGNKYQFHTNEMDTEARQFIQIESTLRNAIDNRELSLYYQPKLNIKKGTITGVEALLRWEHPQLGILNPAQFIQVAEETGLILQIGEWAIREACKTNKYWQNEGYEHLVVSLNLSPRQFQHDGIAHLIAEILRDTGVNPKYLDLEVSESVVMDNMAIAKQRLDAIKETGVQLTIDHFGAGYTSISHLKQFPVSTIKIDKNYIKGVPNTPNDCAITNAFIGLAHHLGLEVVAEGVETAEQVQYLTLQNCDMVQGYFLSHPLPADKIILQFKKLMNRSIF